jgi:uncharacterized protein YjbJ (UPF0337 family)
MHLETNKSEWSETKEKIRTRFGKLTDESIESVKGNLELLKGKIQSAYGYAKDQAEKEYLSFKASLNETPHAATPVASATAMPADSKNAGTPTPVAAKSTTETAAPATSKVA